MNPPSDARARVSELLRAAQDEICSAIERVDGVARFRQDEWRREGGGGGRTRVLQDGAAVEKAGIGFSEIWGEQLPPSVLQARPEAAGHPYAVAGLSMIVHPQNPFAPTVHFNYRYFEAGPVWWFGGGADLTPSYVIPEDAAHFHRAHKAALDAHHPAYHPAWKGWCDDYFFVKHRHEARGVGGIFFDYQDGRRPLYPGRVETELPERGWEEMFAVVRSCLGAFLPAYLPILERRKDAPFTDAQRDFQLWRRGRYVEFNLVHDRGTLFGLQTGGRIESILMSLPPLVRWIYDYKPEPGSPEAQSLELLRPRDWASRDEPSF